MSSNIRSRFTGVQIAFEPADHSVGITSESFYAWPTYSNDHNDGPFVSLDDMNTWKFSWEDSETGKPCERPLNADIVEASLKAFVETFYQVND